MQQALPFRSGIKGTSTGCQMWILAADSAVAAYEHRRRMVDALRAYGKPHRRRNRSQDCRSAMEAFGLSVQESLRPHFSVLQNHDAVFFRRVKEAMMLSRRRSRSSYV